MAADREVQKQRLQQHLNDTVRNKNREAPEHGIIIHDLFSTPEENRLKDALDFLLKDESLQIELKQNFGVSFKDLDALVIPAGNMNALNCERLGITDAGWKDADDKSSLCFSVGGVTVRDRALAKQKATFDGRPRIAIPPWSFATPTVLRLALFHELLHALNIPGYKPLCAIIEQKEYCLIVYQNDLVYLPEYRTFIKRAQLYDNSHENGILLILSILLLMLGRCLQQARAFK